MKENTLSITLISLFFKCKWQIKELFVSTCFWTRLVILCFVFCFILVSSQPQTPLLQAILGKPRILCNTFWLCALWRSILTKIQCCILHSTFCISYICCVTSEFTHSSFNFPRATFKFFPCRSTLLYAIFKFTFKFSGLYVLAFNIEHLAIKFLLSTLDFTYFTYKFALYIQLFNCTLSAGHTPMVIMGLTDQHTPANITIKRLPTGVGSWDLLPSRQYLWHLLSNMADHQSISSSTLPAPVATLREVNIIS